MFKSKYTFIMVFVVFVCAAGLLPLPNKTVYSDSSLHFAGSVALMLLAYLALLLFQNNLNGKWRYLVSLVLAFSPGVVKEIADSFKPRNWFDFGDLAWDFAGVVVGLCIILLVHGLVLLIDKTLKRKPPEL